VGGEDTNNHLGPKRLSRVEFLVIVSWQCFIPVSWMYLDIQRFSRLSHDSFRFFSYCTIFFFPPFFSSLFAFLSPLFWVMALFFSQCQMFPPFFLSEDCSPLLVDSYSCDSGSVKRVTARYNIHWHNHHLTFEMRRGRVLKRPWIQRWGWVKKPGFRIRLDW